MSTPTDRTRPGHTAAGTDAAAGTDTAATVDAWLAAYTEADARSRRTAVASLWHPEGRLVEPPLDAAGHDGIDGLAVAVQSQFAGCRFRRTSELDEHHGTARYEWELVAADGSVVLAGEDIARLDADGRLVEVVGFFGRPAGLT